MNRVEIKPGIYWVGAVDWKLRSFHGYQTKRGSSYNAYLIIDERIVLVDTVKHYLFEEMLARIRKIIDPSKIDYIVCNHVEMDHSGSIPMMAEIAPNAKIIASILGEKGLRGHFGKGLNIQVVNSGETLKIGRRTLQFVHTPMVHWPDSMVTYVPEDKLLLPNDAFGQHIASSERFDYELGWDIMAEESANYYANIVLLYGDQVKKALEALSGLEIDMIAPSHGLIWQSYNTRILERYAKWADNRTDRKAVIVYDSMWGSTEKMAQRLREGLEEEGIPVTMRNLSIDHISSVMTDILEARLILLGSPTLNNGMLPTMGAFLTYLKGLRPKKRTGFAFGSFGWGGQAVGEMDKFIEDIGWEKPVEGVKIKWVPDDDGLLRMKEIGKELARHIKK